MKRLATGWMHEGCVAVSGAGDGADGAPRIDGLLMARPDFTVRMLEIPPVAPRDAEALIRFRLRSLYPGNPAETTFDFLLESANGKHVAVVFIARGGTVERYREAAGAAPLLLPYQLIRPLAGKRKDLRVLFRGLNWLERTEFRGGLPVSDVVRQFDDEEGLAAAADAGDGLRTVFVAEGPEGSPPGAEFHALGRLAAAHRGAGLFGERKRGVRLPPRGIRMAVLAAAVALLSVLAFYRRVGEAEAERDALKARYAALEREVGGALSRRKETEALEAEIRRIAARKPPDLYGFLSALAAVLDGDAVIRSLTVRDDGFRIEAVGSDSLRLMEGFGGNPAFRDVRLSQVVPEERTGRERFSFSGAFDAE